MADHTAISPATGHDTSKASADPAADRILGLRVEPHEKRGHLVVGPSLLNAVNVLWGGCGLAAAIALGEEVLERQALWVTIQYVRPISAGERIDFTVEVGQHGRGLSQASVRGMVNGRLALLATGTFGGRAVSHPRDEALQILPMPSDVKPPSEVVATDRTGMAASFDMCEALAPDTPGSEGRVAVWLRYREPAPTTVALLGIVADYAPIVLNKVFGAPTFGVSLDNSIRVGPIPPSSSVGGRWLLLDSQMEAALRGVAQINARLFDEDGNLLAIAGQSTLVRLPS